jgi:hypothetical protein
MLAAHDSDERGVVLDTRSWLSRRGDGLRHLDVFHHPYAYAAMRPKQIGKAARTSTPTASAA